LGIGRRCLHPYTLGPMAEPQVVSTQRSVSTRRIVSAQRIIVVGRWSQGRWQVWVRTSSVARRVDRALVGVVMATAAWAVERAIVRRTGTLDGEPRAYGDADGDPGSHAGGPLGGGGLGGGLGARIRVSIAPGDVGDEPGGQRR
jgi:hypothetical protein